MLRLHALVMHKAAEVVDERASFVRATVSEESRTVILKGKDNLSV
jgi:hypothetical protein